MKTVTGSLQTYFNASDNRLSIEIILSIEPTLFYYLIFAKRVKWMFSIQYHNLRISSLVSLFNIF